MTHEEILSMLGDYVDYLIANSSACLLYTSEPDIQYLKQIRASAARTTAALVLSVNGYQTLNELLPVCDLLHCLLQRCV